MQRDGKDGLNIPLSLLPSQGMVWILLIVGAAAVLLIAALGISFRHPARRLWPPKNADPAFRARLAEECADVFGYLLLIAERAGIDLPAVTARKIDLNETKYPVQKTHGNARKYTEL